MSGRNKGGKAKIQMTKPEPPPFLQRIREQMLANEGVERREQAELKRKLRPNRPDDPDDDPLIVQLNQDDLTEEEYKRIKHEMETQYKLDSDKSGGQKHEELDVDALIESRKRVKAEKDDNNRDDLRRPRPRLAGDVKASQISSASKGATLSSSSSGSSNDTRAATSSSTNKNRKANSSNAKTLSYGSSSEGDDDDDDDDD